MTKSYITINLPDLTPYQRDALQAFLRREAIPTRDDLDPFKEFDRGYHDGFNDGFSEGYLAGRLEGELE